MYGIDILKILYYLKLLGYPPGSWRKNDEDRIMEDKNDKGWETIYESLLCNECKKEFLRQVDKLIG